jgi:hypothetical protein
MSEDVRYEIVWVILMEYLEMKSLSPFQKEILDSIDDRHGITRWDKLGRPMSMTDWIQCQTKEYACIGWFINWNVAVAAVWLGIDCMGGTAEKPMIFETVVVGVGSKHPLRLVRFASEEEARISYHRLVKAYRYRIDIGIWGRILQFFVKKAGF